jgi:HSP20 family protein
MFLLREGDIRWTPAVDIYDTNDRWLVYIELPGVTSENVDLTVYPESVIVRGIKPPPATELSAEKIEIYTGYFHREVRIPGRICISEVSASMKNGVLSLVLPAEKHSSIRIPVSQPGESLEIIEGD